MEVLTRLPGGTILVFVLVSGIAAFAFLARRRQTRRAGATASATAPA
jgi:hypothetical protein